jgi:hypothetical protein
MKKRYLFMARDYVLLADVEEQAHARRAPAPLQKKPGTVEHDDQPLSRTVADRRDRAWIRR